MSIEIDVLNGDASWPRVEPLMDAVWPRYVVERLPWGHVEWAHAVAPGARIVLVEANSESLPDLMTAVATAAGQPGVSVVSMTWGFAEGQAVFAADEANYDADSNLPLASHLRGDLLLVHGTFDANVSPYETLRLADALIRAGKDFDLVMLPNEAHNYEGAARRFAQRKCWRFLMEHLRDNR